jgi:hypothetical protein
MGKKGKHGAFDSLILGTGDVKRLRASCDAFLVADWEQEKAQAAEVVASEGTFWSDETRAEAWQWLKDNETSPSVPMPNPYVYSPPPKPTLEEWMEGAHVSTPTGEYESRYGKSIMLDEWQDSDTREQAMQAAKLLNPLLDAKTPRKNNKRT